MEKRLFKTIGVVKIFYGAFRFVDLDVRIMIKKRIVKKSYPYRKKYPKYGRKVQITGYQKKPKTQFLTLFSNFLSIKIVFLAYENP